MRSMEKKNKDVREAIKKNGITFWEIADQLGIADTTFSKRLRKELPEEIKAEIFNAVEKLKKQ